MLCLLVACEYESNNPVTDENFAPLEPVQIRAALDTNSVANLVIYQINLLDFTSANGGTTTGGDCDGTIALATNQLGRLEELGINTVLLSPIHPRGRIMADSSLIDGFGSPYSVCDYYEILSELGTKDDFKAFIDEAHRLGIKVLTDLVANHTAWDHPWITEHPEWYTRDSNGNIQIGGGWWFDTADLNYDNDSLRQSMIDVMTYWVEDFDIDGYRCDAADHVPLDFWATAISSIESIKPMIMLSEGSGADRFSAGFELIWSWQMTDGLGYAFNYSDYQHLINAYNTESNYLEPNQLRIHSIKPYTPQDRFVAEVYGSLERGLTAFMLSVAFPGVPHMLNGQEATDPNPGETIIWPANHEYENMYRRILTIRRESQALLYGATAYLPYDDDELVTALRTLGDEMILVIANLGEATINMKLPDLFEDLEITDLWNDTQVAEPNLMVEGGRFRIIGVK
jgi:glycosidase